MPCKLRILSLELFQVQNNHYLDLYSDWSQYYSEISDLKDTYSEKGQTSKKPQHKSSFYIHTVYS